MHGKYRALNEGVGSRCIDGGWEPNRRGKPSMEDAEGNSEVAGAVVPHGMHYTPHYTREVKGLARNLIKKLLYNYVGKAHCSQH